MIFTKRMLDAILAGRKTQTRRVMRPHVAGERSTYVDRGGRTRRRPTARTILWEGSEYRRPPMPADVVAVQPGRGRHAIARIVITDLTSSLVGDIDHFSARAEGFRTTDDFKAYWVGLYEKTVPFTRGLFQESDDGIVCEPPDDELLVDRFDTHHAATPVWVVTFELATDEPRFLAPAGRSHDSDEHGYTIQSNHALEPVEVVSPAVQAEISREGRERGRVQRGYLDQQLLDEKETLEERLAAARRIAHRRGVNVHAEVRLAERALRSIERKIAARNVA